MLFLALVAGALLLSAAGAQAATLTVNSAADAGGNCPGADCSLRQAIATAAPGDTINFAAGITTVNLTSDELLINKNLTISGPGANLLTVQRSNAAGNFRIFDITAGNVTISGLTIANGSVLNTNGGGILNGSGTLTVTGCTISGNVAIDFGGAGGGIYNSGTVSLTNSTVSGNVAFDAIFHISGGGIYNSGTVNLTNSTVSGNSGSGGGIYNRDTVTITNSTISGNSGVGIINNAGTVSAGNTIIAKNIGNPDFSGTLTSQGYNLIGNTSGTTITGTTTGNQLNVDPLLGPLQDNGGPTFTQALLSGSTAIEGGNSFGSNTDQRGLARPVDTPAINNASGGDGSDIGAYEVQADQLPGCGNTLVTNNSDSGSGSLRFMIANQCGGETITFASGVVSPINLTSGELLINKFMAIRGPGANLLTVQRGAAAGSNFRVFHITSGSFDAISGLTIANGNPADNGGGIYNQSGSTLTVTGCAISANSANSNGGFPSSGGGISIFNATTILINCTISGNSATGSGGGIYNNNGTLTITNSTLSGNDATGTSSGNGGGGIYNNGTVNFTNSTVSNNSGINGGGVYNFSGRTVNARNTIIAGNLPANGSSPDFNGALISQGFNFIGNNAGAAITPAQFSDQIGTSAAPKDPLLDTLRNNGGPTQTQALFSGSTAIDKGDSSGSSTDQRGYARPYDDPNIANATGGDGSDIGAFEVQATDIIFRNGFEP